MIINAQSGAVLRVPSASSVATPQIQGRIAFRHYVQHDSENRIAYLWNWRLEKARTAFGIALADKQRFLLCRL